jgi:acetyltransferase
MPPPEVTMERTPAPVQLRTGHTVWVRPVRSSDAAELQRAFAVLSEQSRYRRFLTGNVRLTDRQADFLADLDHIDHEALVALPDEHATHIIGVARFVRPSSTDTDADLAITVADDWHDRGLATALIHRLTERARAVGVRRFTVEMAVDNTPVLRLLRRAGLTGETVSGDVASGYIDLAQSP